MAATIPKEQFLSYDNNRERLISILPEKLVQQGFELRQTLEDTDTLIVNLQSTQFFKHLRHETWKGDIWEHVSLSQVLQLLFCCQTEPFIPTCNQWVWYSLYILSQRSWSLSNSMKLTCFTGGYQGISTMYMLIPRTSFQQANCSWQSTIYLTLMRLSLTKSTTRFSQHSS